MSDIIGSDDKIIDYMFFDASWSMFFITPLPARIAMNITKFHKDSDTVTIRLGGIAPSFSKSVGNNFYLVSQDGLVADFKAISVKDLEDNIVIIKCKVIRVSDLRSLIWSEKGDMRAEPTVVLDPLYGLRKLNIEKE